MVARRREAGEAPSVFKLVTRPPARFVRMFVLKAGFLDGWRGWIVACLGATYVFLKYAKLMGASERGPDDAA